jgi:transposase
MDRLVSVVASRWVGLFPQSRIGHGGVRFDHAQEKPMKALPVVNLKAAGIDVGSEKLFVSIGGDTPRVFGTVTAQLHELARWLKSESVRTVALEATGVYWLCLYEVLETAGIEVVVVNGKHVKSLPGRKTDMADCQWIATLHAHGLLRSGFVPEAEIRRLQDYLRLRQDHITMAASHVQHMQKALERMNIKIHDAISSLTGVSGLKVVRAMLAGERDPEVLLGLCDAQIQKNKSDRVREALQGTWRAEHLFALRHALAGWEFYQARMLECDQAIEGVLREMAGPDDGSAPLSKARPGGQNTPQIEGLHKMILSLCQGKDATALPAMTDYMLLQTVGEVGTDLTRWPSAGHFTAWLGLAPGSHQSGKRRGHQSRQRNRAGRLFCLMARSLSRTVDNALGGFYRRLRARRGGLVANQALARKLAALFWRVMVHGLEFVEKGLKNYEATVVQNEQRLLRKLAKKHHLELTPSAA